MQKKLTVSRKDALIEYQRKERSDSSSSGFSSDDVQSDYEDQLEQNRDLKRRKRDEQIRAEERKIINSNYVPSSTKKLAACVFCKLVLNKEKWRKLEHCPNCPQSSGLSNTTE